MQTHTLYVSAPTTPLKLRLFSFAAAFTFFLTFHTAVTPFLFCINRHWNEKDISDGRRNSKE
jgi:hypothetical protein